MWVRSSAELTENVYHVTTAVSSHLLIWGNDSGIVDTGIAAVHERLANEITRFVGGAHNLKYIFLTHADFDHLGGIPHLRKFAPEIELVASSQTVALLSDTAHLEKCYDKNLECAQAMEVEIDISKEDWLKSFTVDRVLGDGDNLDLGDGVQVKLIACPGHKQDSTAFYVTPDAALQAGEAVGGYYGRDKIIPAFSSDYEGYLQSLDKLSALEIKFLALAHNGVLTGDLVQKFVTGQSVEAERFFKDVKSRLASGEIIDEISAEILQEWKSENICPEGPFVAEQEESLKAMLVAIGAE